MRVLLLVDIQNDFLPSGALPVPGGDGVIEPARQAMETADYVVATQDWHPPDHGSFASNQGLEVGQRFQLNGVPQIAWPDHCIQGQPGAELASGLQLDRIHHVIRKGTDPAIDSYSAFFDNAQQHSTGLHEHLTEIGATNLDVMGLATDYCVKFTVLDAIDLGYAVKVWLAGCRGIDASEGDVDAAIEQMRRAGAEVIG